MARICVLEHFQKETDRPLRSMKLSAGKSLFFAGRAEWIKRNRLIRLLPPGVVHVPLSAQSLPESEPEIRCERMPPVEVRGVRFVDPIKNPAQPRTWLLTRQERLEQFELQ